MKPLWIHDFYLVASGLSVKPIRAACAALTALCLLAPNSVDAAQRLTVTAVGSTASAENEGSAILSGRAPRSSAANDFHEFVCAFNSSGGMMTAIVNAALEQEMNADEFSVSIDGGDGDEKAELSGGSDLSFPWYKPNCNGGSFLTAHTKALCNDFVWSEPIYEMLVGYFSASDFDRPLRKHEDVFGTTLCLAGREFPQMLHEVGLSDLNTRLLFKTSPAACLTAVSEGKADLTLLPINMAALEVEHFGLADKIKAHDHLDRVMTLHVVAPQGTLAADDDIALFNRGLKSLRKSNDWFQIVQEFADGHDHDHAYAADASRSVAANSE